MILSISIGFYYQGKKLIRNELSASVSRQNEMMVASLRDEQQKIQVMQSEMIDSDDIISLILALWRENTAETEIEIQKIQKSLLAMWRGSHLIEETSVIIPFCNLEISTGDSGEIGDDSGAIIERYTDGIRKQSFFYQDQPMIVSEIRNMYFVVVRLNEEAVISYISTNGQNFGEMGEYVLYDTDRGVFLGKRPDQEIEKLLLNAIEQEKHNQIYREQGYLIHVGDIQLSSFVCIRFVPETEVFRVLNFYQIILIFVCYGGRLWASPQEVFDGLEEYKNRRQFIDETTRELDLETPDLIINRLFAFAKIRSSESVFQTRKGLMHSPGGLHYYGAVWTNDQVEYAGPFFTYLGRREPIEASINAYRLYIPFMGPGYECIPTSIVAEGNDIWEGKGDRGDCAMYAYGASHYALSLGERAVAEELYPAIVWCLEYSKRKRNKDGVICSDSDELEGRFPAGTANLSTSCLVYEALRMAAILAKELGDEEHRREYEYWREELGNNIECFFGRTLKGYETYRYCDVSDALRAWICIPLTMGIYRRKEGTIRALLSQYLWMEDGLLSMEGDATFWDRSTLYGLRGIFCAGEAEKGWKHLKSYSKRRLLGEHVPYPVEAYPEGDQRHLSAESALYCRIFLEGILGISPEGLDRFSMHPCLPLEWNYLRIKNIHGYGTVFDIFVEREDTVTHGNYTICICEKNKKECRRFTVTEGENVLIAFENGKDL